MFDVGYQPSPGNSASGRSARTAVYPNSFGVGLSFMSLVSWIRATFTWDFLTNSPSSAILVFWDLDHLHSTGALLCLLWAQCVLVHVSQILMFGLGGWWGAFPLTGRHHKTSC